MARKISTRPSAVASSRAGFDCQRYEATAGSKRCRYYHDGGGCHRPDAEEGRCIEWLKVNAPSAFASSTTRRAQPPVDRDLFGNPIQPDERPRVASSKSARPQPETLAPTPPSSSKPPLVRNVTDEEIASFKELGVEVCIRSEALGDVYLVPVYTGQDRTELSIEHSLTLTAICATFPGAKVVELKRRV